MYYAATMSYILTIVPSFEGNEPIRKVYNYASSAHWGKLEGHMDIVHLTLCPIILLMSNNTPVLVFINDL